MEHIDQYIRAILPALKDAMLLKRTELSGIEIADGDYSCPDRFCADGFMFRKFETDETWGGADRHFWFRAEVPENAGIPGKPLYLLVRTGAVDIWDTDNPQIIGFLNGRRTASMDMNHQDMLLEECCGGKPAEVAFYAYSNQARKSLHFYLEAVVPDPAVQQLYYDVKVLFDACELLAEGDPEKIAGERAIYDALCLLDLRDTGSAAFRNSVELADKSLRENYYDSRKEAPVTVHSIGYTHIDVAWKWPIRQTRQKAVRSYQTVLNLMKEYPEYRFSASTPELYEFVREDAPDLFEEIRKKIQEGRWEAEGGMWLEPDCNLISGESMVRQFLYGTRYFEEVLHTGKQEVLFLPDVFGYSAALPQIMRGFGLSYFMTTKMGWNDSDKFPYDTFLWRGLDGSPVLTQLVTTRDYDPSEGHAGIRDRETTYNGRQNPDQLMGTWQRYQQKNLTADLVTLYGFGDGGGGPTREMLEQSRRMEHSIARVPRVQQSSLREFFHQLEEGMDRRFLPEWDGELYLEYHRGTYTSRAETKRNNRKAEIGMLQTEFLSVLALLAGNGFAYPKAQLDQSWLLLLRNQFHDILPGSSIHEVYEQSDREYAQIMESNEKLNAAAFAAVLKGAGCAAESRENSQEPLAGAAVFNMSSFSGEDAAELSFELKSEALRQKTKQNTWLYLFRDVPCKGYRLLGAGEEKTADETAVISDFRKDPQSGELSFRTDYYEVCMNEEGELLRLYDRLAGREVIGSAFPECREEAEHCAGNRILAYEDRPDKYENWNVESYYREKFWTLDPAESCELSENGPVRAVLHIRRRFMESVLEQDVIFYRHTKRIDFRTRMDWRQHQLLVRVQFPVKVFSFRANFDIPFGNVERPTTENTSWDRARFEVCAHRWMDLSDSGYGAALLNDCRYGCSVHHNVLSLSLLRNGTYPDPDPDTGVHEFTYSLYPHEGDFRSGHVIREASRLNEPMKAIPLAGMAAPAGPVAFAGERAGSYSFVQADSEGFVLETIKQSEDGQGIICRGYEAWGRQQEVSLCFAENFRVVRVRMDERADENPDGNSKESSHEHPGLPLPAEGGRVILCVRPYEIVTLYLEWQQEGRER